MSKKEHIAAHLRCTFTGICGFIQREKCGGYIVAFPEGRDGMHRSHADREAINEDSHHETGTERALKDPAPKETGCGAEEHHGCMAPHQAILQFPLVSLSDESEVQPDHCFKLGKIEYGLVCIDSEDVAIAEFYDRHVQHLSGPNVHTPTGTLKVVENWPPSAAGSPREPVGNEEHDLRWLASLKELQGGYYSKLKSEVTQDAGPSPGSGLLAGRMYLNGGTLSTGMVTRRNRDLVGWTAEEFPTRKRENESGWEQPHYLAETIAFERLVFERHIGFTLTQFGTSNTRSLMLDLASTPAGGVVNIMVKNMPLTDICEWKAPRLLRTLGGLTSDLRDDHFRMFHELIEPVPKVFVPSKTEATSGWPWCPPARIE